MAVSLAMASAGEPALPAFSAPAKPRIPSRVFLVTDYGAVGDGQTDCTIPIQKAISAALATGGGTVNIPDGTFLSSVLTLGSNLRLNLSDKAILKMVPLSAFPHSAGKDDPPFLGASDCHDIEISGHGMIDGQGEPWWTAFRAKQLAQRRPQFISIRNSKTLLFTGFTTLNPPNCHFAISNSEEVTFDGVIVSAPGTSSNTDGINLNTVRHCLVQNCTVATGDDNIVLLTSSKPVTGGASSNFLITHCKLGVGHGLSIGSYTGGGVENVAVTDCSFDGTTAGIRLKADRDRGGLVQNISYDRITMNGVRNPVYISSYYTQSHTKDQKSVDADPAQPVTQKTPVWRNISIRNLTVKDSPNAGIILGLPEMPVSHLTFQNVSIEAKTGMVVNNAKDIFFSESQISVSSGPKIIQKNAQVTGIDGAPSPTAP